MADIRTFVGTGIVIISALGGSVGYFAKSRGDSIIKYQALEIDELTRSTARLEKDNAALLSENKLLHEQNKKLGDLAQGSPQLKKLTQAVTALTRIINNRIAEQRQDNKKKVK